MSKNKIDGAVQQAQDFISSLCEPRRMTQTEALEFLEQVAAGVDASMDALREEMGDDD